MRDVSGEWSGRDDPNFAVLEPGEVVGSGWGHEIVFGPGLPATGAERVGLDLVRTADGLVATCELGRPGESTPLARTRCPGSAGRSPHAGAVREALVDACVDAIIELSREVSAPASATSCGAREEVGESRFDEYAAAEDESRRARRRWQECSGDHVRWSAPDGRPGVEVPRGAVECAVPAGGIELIHLEWLALSLQVLMNSRKRAVFSHVVSLPGGKLARFAEISSDSAVGDVVSALGEIPMSVVENPFYDFTDVFEDFPDSGFAIEFGCGVPESSGALVVLRFCEHRDVIRISYPRNLPFFAQLSEHVDAFFERLPGLRGGERPFFDFTALAPPAQRRMELETATAEFDPTPIHHAIERQTRSTPEAPALVHEGVEWSYRQLNEAANRLAHHLREQFAPERGAPVAVHLDRNADLLIALLAVLKLGCAYVPLDKDAPVQRIGLILSGSRPALVLTDTLGAAALAESGTGAPLVPLDDPGAREAVRGRPNHDLDIAVAPADLAYVIHTSGTTGAPKGVAVEHRNFANIAADIGDRIGFGPDDRALAVTTIAFDISTLEVFLPLMRGGCVVLAGQQDLLDIEKLLVLVDRGGVTVMQATPSLWQLLVPRLAGRKLAVRALCGGEALPPDLAAELVEAVEECWNVYGPTETTVWSTAHRLVGASGTVPIGRPVANTRCYVLDELGRPLPEGVVGELHIAGSGVARGYLHDEEQTADRFMPDLVAGGERMYRTGDLVRSLPGGTLEFAGRNDFQVKLRGHRIELGEIENALRTHPAVAQSLVVVADGSGAEHADGRFLAAYVVADSERTEEIREHLTTALPEYMVPAVLIPLPALPLNVNGKVDRGALPDPELHRVSGHVAPATELEERLCELWQAVLGREVGVTDDFFRSGGNSILGILLVNRINSVLGVDLKIRDLFREKSVRGLVPLVRSGTGEFLYRDFVLGGLDGANLHEPFPLTNVQQTYYLGRFHNFELSDLSTHVYTEFRYAALDVPRLEEAFNGLLLRHHALRTVFEDGEQRFLPEVARYRIERHELRDEAELDELRGRYSHKTYDPQQYPLFDVVVSRLDGVYRLHVSFDAIVVDMTSFGVLFDEWARRYRDPALELPEPGISYRDYVLGYERVRESELLAEAQDYWEAKVSDYRIDLNLPIRMRPSSVGKPHFRRKSAVIAAPVWRELSDKCRRFGISPTGLILEVYGRVLGMWSGQDRLCVNLTLFNRLPLHPEVTDLVGDFTVLGLFDHRTRRDLGIAAKLRQVHDELLRDIDHNLFDGVDVQRLLKTTRGLPVDQVVAPAVLTSTLGSGSSANLFELVLDGDYLGVDHSISQTSQVWLDNKAYETAEGFVAEWDYVEQLFDEQVVEDMHAAYCWLLERLAELDWEADSFPVPPLPSADLALIEQANDHHRPGSEATLVSLCEIGKGDPEFGRRTAVVDAARDERFCYAELHRDSHSVAAGLLDGAAGTLVGLLAEKGYLQAVGALGIMGAGGAYVPMSAEWPGGRVGEVLAQAGVRTLLVSNAQRLREDVAALDGVELVVIEDLLSADPDPSVRLPAVTADDTAYVIFTSGSTGTPKGVTISHRGAVNTILAVNDRFGVGPGDSVLAVSELSFDLSVYDLFGVLGVGGTVVFPAQEDTRDPAKWADLVQRHEITLWNSVPQLAGLLVDQVGAEPGSLASLRTFLLSGDWIPTALPDALRRAAPHSVVMSLGGATEGSIWSVWFEIGAVDPKWTSIPYGVAMPNQRMYVLDSWGGHCPVGVVGEVHIGGTGVALGYWGDPGLSGARFVEHPVLGRLYRTGDLGRWSGAGWMEFLGRTDFQVKLNGYRVELEEITAKLSRLPGVDRAVVTIQDDEDRNRLVGHLVAAERRLGETGDAELDRAGFLLAAHGVLHDAEPGRRLGHAPDPEVHAVAKSYRRFLDEDVDLGLIRKRHDEVRDTAAPIRGGARLDVAGWAAVLGCCAAVELPGRATPKYRYPSAGGSYAVRVFAGIDEQSLRGAYYHHPLTGELRGHALAERILGGGDEIALVAHWPAIVPLQGERSREFAVLEAGHLLGLLTAELEARGVPHEVEVVDERITDDDTVLCRIRPGTGSGGFAPERLRLAGFARTGDDEYAEQDGTRRVDLAEFGVFDRVTDAYAVLRSGRCVVSWEGEDTDVARLSAGFLFQRLRDRLHDEGIGTCALGFHPTERGVHTMLAGRVSAEELSAPSSAADARDLTEVLTAELADLLPAYMLPGGYAVLDELPLSANGKVATDRLPAVRVASAYVEPAGAEQWALTRAWSRVLHRSPDELSAVESFFALGGTSLSAMRLVRVLQQELGYEMSLRDLYELDTIAGLAARFGADTEADREEGEL
ncbi:amino acid adenylation domain-containing protein [Saccharopolyspora sp. NFXS83]|uniref:non-ribosomal peptide synthetase n=1 Tax=Saccharopolyspora sp. NFXS83 TaxID=2993560 RepID=UPI00224B5FE7|nr:non-ribosomal peptide synthetase [Saccharopolyspora sp. NFXS83]MCX2730649.1 amino acid adenylation domain-containing protein [Saccharopolyspora sp. NFXS83]